MDIDKAIEEGRAMARLLLDVLDKVNKRYPDVMRSTSNKSDSIPEQNESQIDASK